MSAMRIESITVTGLLSFGWEPTTLDLKPQTVLVGPNGSGKTNLLLALDLLRAAVFDIRSVPSAHGGALEFFHKGKGGDGRMVLETVFTSNAWPPLRYSITLAMEQDQLVIEEERLETRDDIGEDGPLSLALVAVDRVLVRVRAERDAGADRSAIAQFGPLRRVSMEFPRNGGLLRQYGQSREQMPWLADVAKTLDNIAVYHSLPLGSPLDPARLFQLADKDDRRLLPDGSNLALVLNRLKKDDKTRTRLLAEVCAVYEQLRDFDVDIRAGYVQLYVQEESGYSMSAGRLSSGTLRWLGLVTLLVDPAPPSVLCIDEPELGLHPDLIHRLAGLIKEASERCQVVITTHSPDLVSEFSDCPESVVVCERPFDVTELKRLEREPLAHWLAEYSLGHAWQSGAIGGRR